MLSFSVVAIDQERGGIAESRFLGCALRAHLGMTSEKRSTLTRWLDAFARFEFLQERIHFLLTLQ